MDIMDEFRQKLNSIAGIRCLFPSSIVDSSSTPNSARCMLESCDPTGKVSFPFEASLEDLVVRIQRNEKISINDSIMSTEEV